MKPIFKSLICLYLLACHLNLSVDIEEESIFCILNNIVTQHEAVHMNTWYFLFHIFLHRSHAQRVTAAVSHAMPHNYWNWISSILSHGTMIIQEEEKRYKFGEHYCLINFGLL